MRRELALLWVAASVFAGTARADADPHLGRLFPREAEIRVAAQTGLGRLALPSDVLRACAADLADVRVFDASGSEVPFLVDSASRPVLSRADRVVELSAEPTGLRRESRARPGLAPLRVEVFLVSTPKTAPAAGVWELVVGSPRSEFVRSLTVRPKHEGAGEAAPLASASVFRLKQPLRERRSVPLPAALPSSVEVTLEGEGEYLEPTFAFRAVEPAPADRTLAIPLVELGRYLDDGRTRVELARPRGVIPDRLRFETSTPTFFRPVTVRDAGPGGEGRDLGRTSLFRVQDLPGAFVQEVELDGTARSDRLEIELDDATSPPLEALSVVAVVSQPTLVFEAARGRLLRFGGGRARSSAYDVQRFQGSLLGHTLIQAAGTDAVLGPRRDNPGFDPLPALEFAMRPGAQIDLARFSHRRSVRVDGAPEGLSRIVLGPEELSRLTADLSDLRFVDADGRQWPYLIERGGVSLDVPVAVRALAVKPGESRYALELPRAPLTLDRVELATPAQFLDREAELVGTTERGERRVLFKGRIARRPGDTTALPLSFPAERLNTLELRIDDASDAPVVLDAVSAHIAAGEIYLAAPSGSYAMLFGDSRKEPARYELERARELALAVPIAPASMGPLEDNPSYVRPSRLRPPDVALWAAIVLAVGTLGALTLRLARREAPEEADAPE